MLTCPLCAETVEARAGGQVSDADAYADHLNEFHGDVLDRVLEPMEVS